MKNYRIRATSILAILGAMGASVASFATEPTATMPTISWATSADTVVTSLGSVMTAILPFAGVLLALKLGFGWFKKLTSKAAG